MEIFKVKLIYHLCLSFFLWIQMAPSGVIPFLQHSFIHFCVTVKYITILSICYRPNNTMLQIILCNCLLNQLKKKGKEMLNYTFHHYLHSQLYWKSLFFFFFNEDSNYCLLPLSFSLYNFFQYFLYGKYTSNEVSAFVYLDTSSFHFHF